MRHVLIGVSLLALAGCTTSEPAANATQNSANATVPVLKPWPKLGDFDLRQPIRAAGTEPFWTLDVAPGSMDYTDYSVDAPAAVPFFPVTPKVEGDKAVYATKDEEGVPIVLTLTHEKCLDAGEEEDSQPLTATLKIGARTLTGCAGPRPKATPPGDGPVAGNAANASGD